MADERPGAACQASGVDPAQHRSGDPADVAGAYPPAALLDDPALLQRMVELTGRRMRATSSGVRAGQLLDRHARVIAEAASAHVAAGSGADLAPERVVLHVLANGDVSHADVPAGGPGERTALAIALARDAAALHEPLVAALALRRGRAAPVLWRTVGDRVAIALSAAVRAAGHGAEAPGLIAAVIAADPRYGKPRRTGVARAEGAERPFLVRQGCCLSYRTVKDQPCFTCPLLDDEGRAERLAEEVRAERSAG